MYKTPLGWHIQIGGELFVCSVVSYDDNHLLLRLLLVTSFSVVSWGIGCADPDFPGGKY